MRQLKFLSTSSLFMINRALIFIIILLKKRLLFVLENNKKCYNYRILIVDMGKKIKKQATIKLQNIEQQPKQTHQQPKPAPLEPKKPKLEQSHQSDDKNKQKSKKQGKDNKTKKIKRARLVIRNLVFDINEKHIRKLISPFGQVKQINIPKHPDQSRSKGFAFVQMTNKIDCLKAIKKLNGTQYKGRPIVLDLAVSKENFMTEKLKQKQGDKKQIKQESVHSQNQEDIKKQEQEQADEISNEEQIQNEEKSEEQEESEDQQVKEEKQKQDHLYQIFVRNLPISTTQEDLYKHFIKYGKIAFAVVCKNKETNVSKGTAFIKFYDQDVAHKLIQYSRSYEMFLLKKLRNFTPDPTIKLQIDGTIMKIFPVESRKEISSKLKERENDGKTDKKVKPVKRIKKLQDLVKIDFNDKRKLSLSLLGRWKAQQNMNKYDYELLKNHEKQKIQKLKNPNSQVSDTRIILKHLQKTITEQELRTICLKFLQDRNLSKSSLTYCKLMLERDMKRSAGYAFVQFRKHEISKDFINYLVASPNVIQSQLYIVQFAIQDSRKMLKLSRKNQVKTPNTNNKEKRRQNKKGGISSNPEKKQKHKKMKRKMIKK